MIIVIGGGPAGCMAALTAAGLGAEVHLLEQNEKIGKKWYITGKGRCNLTNNQDMQSHLLHVRRNPKFLLGPYARYTKDDIQKFFEARRVPMKVERGDRVFPVSDKSSDTIAAFEAALREVGVRISLQTRVTEIVPAQGGFTVQTSDGPLVAKAVIVATGGLSYPTTGATGDGFRWAKTMDHTVTPLVPSLVGVNLKDPYRDLSGLSLRNVRLQAAWGKKRKKWFGELLFTHYGLSGPIVLQMSAERPLPESDFLLSMNLKPALQPDVLDARLLREANESPGKEIQTLMERLLPSSLVQYVLEAANVDGRKKAAVMTVKDRQKLTGTLQAFPLHPAGFRGFNEAVVTRGGIHTKEVDAKTMMSKKQEGLFFAGELLDLDADTGGYNMQIAWSTGFVAGESAAMYVQKG